MEVSWRPWRGATGLGGVAVAARFGYENSHAPVAQLDRALPSEGRGHKFESCRARHFGTELRARRPAVLRSKRRPIGPSSDALTNAFLVRPPPSVKCTT